MRCKVVSVMITHQVMKTYAEVEVYFHAFLVLALDGGEWLA
jgi:hypothetical protein